MKQIFLLRHAKSDWDEPFLSDEKRGLSERGKKQTKALRSFLLDYQLDIDAAFVSPAIRAERTYATLRKEILRLPKPEVRDSIYEAAGEDLLFLCHGIPDSIHSALIVGHNPGLDEFANGLLFGNTEPSRLQKFPTASFIGLTFAGESWKELSWGTARLKVFWIPGRIGKE
jgi:phosphohistidine phosphatase